jgi:hypothetical protein
MPSLVNTLMATLAALLLALRCSTPEPRASRAPISLYRTAHETTSERVSSVRSNDCLLALRRVLAAKLPYVVLRRPGRATLLQPASVERIAAALGSTTCVCEPVREEHLLDALRDLNVPARGARPCLSLRPYGTEDFADPVAALELFGATCASDETDAELVIVSMTASGPQSCRIPPSHAPAIIRTLRDAEGQPGGQNYEVRLDSVDTHTPSPKCDEPHGHCSYIRQLGICLMDNLRDWPRYDCPSTIDVTVDKTGHMSAANIELDCKGSEAASRCIRSALQEQRFAAEPARVAFHIALRYIFSVHPAAPLPRYGNDFLLQ